MKPFIRAGLIGHPVSHSLSPKLHAGWISQFGLSGSYEAVDVAPGTLEEAVSRLARQGWAGFNVTIPHKQDIMKLCADLSDEAKAAGAVNTVAIREGALYGMNTDIFGFTENIRVNAPLFSFRNGPAFVLGAGGAARAVLYALREQGAPEILIANRTFETAAGLAGEFGGTAVRWDDRERAARDAHFIVNTTSLGMTGKGALSFDVAGLRPDALVHDIVYAPLVTPLLADAAARGLATVTGIGMLFHQARPAFESWFGVLPGLSAAEAKMLEARLLA